MPTRGILERLGAGEFLVLDGATGTELQKRGVSGSEPAWSAVANLESSEVLSTIHADYLEIDADIITANNFSVSRSELALIGKGESWEEYAAAGLDVALKVRDEVKPEALVAGGVHPEGADEAQLKRRIELLAERGVDLVLAEASNTIADCVRVAEASRGVDLPLFIGIGNLDVDGALQDGASFEALVRALDGYDVAGLMAMCSFPPAISVVLPQLLSLFSGYVGVYPHCGLADTEPGVVTASDLEHSRYYPPDEFARYASSWKEMGAQIIGGCCGTGQAHIAELV
jgi:homocysteine S-methyltransferase